MCVKKGGVGFITYHLYFEPTPLLKKKKLEQKFNPIPTYLFHHLLLLFLLSCY